MKGDYPKYQALIPESTTGRAVVSREQFLQASRRVALLSNPKSYAICLEISTEQIHLSTNTPELGEAHETISVESCNGRERIGLDARLLIETLSHIETESVALEFTSAVTTVAFKTGRRGWPSLSYTPDALGLLEERRSFFRRNELVFSHTNI